MKFILFILGVLLMCITSTLSTDPVQFIPSSDPRLNQNAKKVSKKELKSEQIQELIHGMLVLAGYEADSSQTKKKSRLVGIAAPQVGVMKQIIIIDAVSTRDKAPAAVSTRDKAPAFEVLINPEIVWISKERNSIPQGCFSVPNQFTGLVERPSAVVIRALNPEGHSIHKRYEGYPAHVVQHEIDHLHGIRFPQRLHNEKELHILPKGDADLPSYRKNWKNWPHHASSETWIQFKEGQYNLTN